MEMLIVIISNRLCQLVAVDVILVDIVLDVILLELDVDVIPVELAPGILVGLAVELILVG